MAAMLANAIGWEAVVVLVVIALLFGGNQLPKLARSLGSAKSEFEKGLREGGRDDEADKKPADDKPGTSTGT